MKDKKDNKKKLANFAKITIHGYDVSTTEDTTKQVTEQIKKLKIDFAGPYPLPTKVKTRTVPISPHKHKDAQEHFIRKIHRRVIRLKEINDVIISSLSRLNFPETVNLTLKAPF